MTAHYLAQAEPVAGRFRGGLLSAYRIATANAAFFFLFSLGNVIFDSVPISIHCAAADIFMLGSVFSFYQLYAKGGGFSAISIYVLSSGIIFGFGTAYSTIAEGYVFELLFSEPDQVRNLPTINLMNSLSVLIVLIFALSVSKITNVPVPRLRLNRFFNSLQPFNWPLLLLSSLIIATVYLTFPVPENLILRGALEKLAVLPSLTVLICFAGWDRLPINQKIAVVLILIAMIAMGLLAASKTAAMIPFVAMAGGVYLHNYRKASIILIAVTAAWYFFLLAPVVNQMRSQSQYDPITNTPAQRLGIFSEALTNISADSSSDNEGKTESLLYRFVHGSTQSFLIDEWRNGRPGDSLADSWAALVPRVLWPEKPIITRFGPELYLKIYVGVEGGSAQAPTYTGEAYWNYGWLGVVVVSILIGLELGWFTRKWLEFIYTPESGIGALIFCVPVAVSAFSVESWIAATYIGGFVTLAILIKFTNFIAPNFIRGVI
jgi:hypothetical protein